MHTYFFTVQYWAIYVQFSTTKYSFSIPILFYIQPEENVISIMNNGKGIPVVMHKDENMYVPTMIFGHLLTSSNFNDEEQKVCKHDTKSG